MEQEWWTFMANLTVQDTETGDVIGITKFGASAPLKEVLKHYGFTVENVVERAKKVVEKNRIKNFFLIKLL